MGKLEVIAAPEAFSFPSCRSRLAIWSETKRRHADLPRAMIQHRPRLHTGFAIHAPPGRTPECTEWYLSKDVSLLSGTRGGHLAVSGEDPSDPRVSEEAANVMQPD